MLPKPKYFPNNPMLEICEIKNRGQMMIRALNKFSKAKVTEIGVTSKTRTEFNFILLLIVLAQEHFRRIRPKNMVKYVKKYYPLLYRHSMSHPSFEEFMHSKIQK